MPPAPTMPMMVAERVFDLEIVEHLARDHRQHLRQQAEADPHAAPPPPVDTTPSTGLRSAVSIASENSLPKAPMSRRHDREHAGEGAEADDVDPDQRPDQRVDAADACRARGATAKCARRVRRRCSWPRGSRAARRAAAASSVPRKAIASVSASAFRIQRRSARCRVGRQHQRHEVRELAEPGAEPRERELAAARRRGRAAPSSDDDDARLQQRAVRSARNTSGWRASQARAVGAAPLARIGRLMRVAPRRSGAWRSRSVTRSITMTVAMISSRMRARRRCSRTCGSPRSGPGRCRRRRRSP